MNLHCYFSVWSFFETICIRIHHKSFLVLFYYSLIILDGSNNGSWLKTYYELLYITRPLYTMSWVYYICFSSPSSPPLTFFPARICSLSGLAEAPDFVFSTDRPNGLGQDDEVSLAPHAIWREELRLQRRPPCERAPTATARDSAPKTHLNTLSSHSPPAVQERLWHAPGTVCSNTEQSKAPGIWTSNTAHCGLVAYGLLIMAALRCADSWGWLWQDYERIWAGYGCLWECMMKISNKEYIYNLLQDNFSGTVSLHASQKKPFHIIFS